MINTEFTINGTNQKLIRELLGNLQISQDIQCEFVSVTIPITNDFETIVNSINLFPRMLFENKSVKYASFGRLVEISSEGSAKFHTIETQMCDVFMKFNNSNISPFFLGGYSFSNTQLDELWGDFGHSKFILGKIQILDTGSARYLLLNYRENENPVEIYDYFLEHLNDSPRNSISITDFKDTVSLTEWDERIKKCKEVIEDEVLEKIVMARSRVFQDDKLSTIGLHIYNYLRKSYPDCYNFHYELNRGDYFVGATPELLVEKDNNNIHTVALAGSIARGETMEKDLDLEKKLQQDPKEISEHQIVMEEIINNLNTLGKIKKDPYPKILKLNNIQHLKTDIFLVEDQPISIHQLIEKLHPTPAVGGKPRNQAVMLIDQLEDDRGWYASPLGIVDRNMNGTFVVALRSAKAKDDKIVLYAGAGIVAGSYAEREWQETNIKFKPLMEALQ